MSGGVVLGSWRDTATRAAIVDFVGRVTDDGGPDDVEPADRIAVFDNDGTLWCEPDAGGARLHPQRLAEMAHDDYSAAAHAYLQRTHSTLSRPYHQTGYLPMIELLSYLEAHGLAMYGIPAERIIGSSNGLRYLDDEHGGTVAYAAEMDVFDDGPVKPVRIWSRIGRRPIIAGGNSNGDIPMLRYTGGRSRPALRLLVLHDDADREFDYTAGAEKSLDQAAADDWTVISIKRDWSTVFSTS
jgi:hypothetical protein